MAAQMDVPLLGTIPLDPEVVEKGDKGRLDVLIEKDELEVNRAYGKIVEGIIKG